MNSDAWQSAPPQLNSFATNTTQLLQQNARAARIFTCKCPWYILSAPSAADLSVRGSADLFHTCQVSA